MVAKYQPQFPVSHLSDVFIVLAVYSRQILVHLADRDTAGPALFNPSEDMELVFTTKAMFDRKHTIWKGPVNKKKESIAPPLYKEVASSPVKKRKNSSKEPQKRKMWKLLSSQEESDEDSEDQFCTHVSQPLPTGYLRNDGTRTPLSQRRSTTEPKKKKPVTSTSSNPVPSSAMLGGEGVILQMFTQQKEQLSTITELKLEIQKLQASNARLTSELVATKKQKSSVDNRQQGEEVLAELHTLQGNTHGGLFSFNLFVFLK
jgi:hypothetical protein